MTKIHRASRLERQRAGVRNAAEFQERLTAGMSGAVESGVACVFIERRSVMMVRFSRDVEDGHCALAENRKRADQVSRLSDCIDHYYVIVMLRCVVLCSHARYLPIESSPSSSPRYRTPPPPAEATDTSSPPDPAPVRRRSQGQYTLHITVSVRSHLRTSFFTTYLSHQTYSAPQARKPTHAAPPTPPAPTTP